MLLRYQLSIHVYIRCRQPAKILRRQLRPASFGSLEAVGDDVGSHVSTLQDTGARPLKERHRHAKNVPSHEATLGDIGARLHRHNTEKASANLSALYVAQNPQLQPDPADAILERLLTGQDSTTEDPRPSAQYVPQHHRSQPDQVDAVRERLFTSKDSTTKDLDLLNRMLCEEEGVLKDYLQQCKDEIEAKGQISSANRSGTIADHGSLAGQDIFADILIHTCQCRSKDPLGHYVGPTVSEVIRLFLKHNIMDHRWHDVLGIRIGALLESVHDPISAEVTQEISDLAAPIFEELLKVWAIYLEDDEAKRILMGPIINVSKSSIPRDFSDTRISNQRVDIIAAAAILAKAYYQLLIAKNIPIPMSTESAKSFRQVSEILSRKCEPDRHVFQGLSTCLLEHGTPLDIIDKAIDRAMINCIVCQSKVGYCTRVSLPENADENDNMAWDWDQVEMVMKRLDVAKLQLDSETASSLWRIFQTKSMREDATRQRREGVFYRFIDAFFTVQRPDLAVKAWNLMINSHVVPTESHWHAMMWGSARRRDFASMRACWFQMKAAGIEPNMKTWTTWIHGLIKCGEWQLGLEALEEVGRLWKKMPKLRNSLKEGPVAGAIAASLAMDMPHVVPKILDWAKEQKLRLGPNAFNTMLASAVSKGELKRVDEILSEMRRRNCPPNSTTFTILIKGRLRDRKSSFHTQSPNSQQATILELLNNLQQKGFQIDKYVYSAILSGLMALDVVNVPATSAVLKHMMKNKVQPLQHVCTSLMRYFFKAASPDLPFIDALWRGMRRELIVADPVFFDCVIEGYAHIGELERMLEFARQMPVQGKTQSWETLSTMLAVLVRAQKWQLTDDFIDDLTDGKNGLRQPHTEHGGDPFWDVVTALREQGLLKPKKMKEQASRPA